MNFMILIELFFTCFKVGLFTIGGGAAIIPILQQEIVAKGWIDMESVTTFIAISESTPGPIAINMATFVGSFMGKAEIGGFLGSLLGAFFSTLGMVMPSFIIILMIAKFFSKFAENSYVKKVLVSIRPFVVGMIFSAGVYLALSAVGIHNVKDMSPDFVGIGMTAILAAVMFGYKAVRKKDISVIPFILVAACVGMLSSLVV